MNQPTLVAVIALAGCGTAAPTLSSDSLSVPRTACGEVTDLQGGYVTADRSLLVLLPQAELGGDSCMEELAVDRLMLVPIGAR